MRHTAGVIGMGIGEKHAIAYQSHPNCLLKSVVDTNYNRRVSLIKKFPELIISNDADSIIEDESIDVVSIASYDNFHSEQIVKSLEYGKHVMSEKPLCLHEHEFLEIVNALRRNDSSKLSSNLVLRTNARFNRFFNDIRRGYIGSINYIEADYFWGRREKLEGWRADMDYYSIILGSAIHMIDLVMWFIGDRPVSVISLGNNNLDVDTKLRYNAFAVILLMFEDGMIAKITGNGECIHPHFHGIKLFGSKKTAVQDYAGSYYFDSSDPKSGVTKVTEAYPDKDSRNRLIHSFIDHIDDSSTSRPQNRQT